VHNAAFGAAGIDAVYVPFRVPMDTLGQFCEDMPRLGLRGLSVTIPHKESIAKFLTKVDPAVKGIGAVNTVLFKDNEVLGYNTDYKAAMDSLESAFGPVGAIPSPLKDKRVLVLGAGGVARAIMYGLERRGAKATIAGRTRSRAQHLADQFSGRAVDWQARHNADVDIIVNCTPIGMHPNVDETPFGKSYLKPAMLVFDTVYNPESTLLLKEAKSHGCRTVTGVDMFVRQAELQYMLFTGREAPHQIMRETLKRAIGPVKF
jgi:3-dehydroquinate dehydratase/shikimate dehydrogenase